MQPISSGAVGPAVTDIQQRLRALGHDVSDDEPGVFGPATTAAIRAFQQTSGLVADAIVGDDTWRALVEAGWKLGDRLLYETRPMLRGDDVRELQRRLNRLGFDAGYVDGILGPETAEAIREFQLNVGLEVDGAAGPTTVDALLRLHRQHQTAPAFAVRERESLRADRQPSLAAARVLVDAAHGPETIGCRGSAGLEEHQITWQIANRVEGMLSARGVRVFLTRGPNNEPSPSERAQLANREDVHAIVSVHLNALPSPDARGVAAYYFGQEHYVSERGRRLAQLLVDRVVDTTGTLDCRTHQSTATLLRESRAPAVILEPGFLSHPEEGPALARPDYQAKIAAAISEAVSAYLIGE